jgi:flavin reductase (DIM6/NTAB) family NADH-FMN oxidoreductase RutF
MPGATEAATIFQRIDRPLWLLTAAAAGRRGGLIATFVSEASLVPDRPRVLVGLGKIHHTCALVAESRAFGLHLLAEDQVERVWQFGLRTGRDLDKLEGLPAHPGATGAPLLSDAASWLDCRVEAVLDTGDRLVFLAEVVAAHAGPAVPVLTAERMIALASAEQRAELVRQREHDSALDRAAIDTWRAGREGSGA